MAYGNRGHLALSFQNSFGTKLTTSQYWIPIVSESVTLKKEDLTDQNMRGRFDEGDSYEGLNTVDGDIEMEANPTVLGAILKAVLDDPTTTVVHSYVRSHVYIPRSGDFDVYAAGNPFTITKHLADAGSAHQFYDLVGNGLELSIANGELLKAKLSVLGGKYTQVAAGTPSFPTDKGWSWDVTSVSIGGTAQPDVMNMTVKLEENLTNKHTLGTAKTPQYTLRDGMRSVGVEGTFLFANQDEYQEFVSQSERELILTLTGATAIQSGYKNVLEIKLPLMKYTEFGPALSGPGKIEASFTAKGKYSSTSGTSLRITLTNTQAGY